jgi:RNA polymerase sigma-70 factor (ECF subfamily)
MTESELRAAIRRSREDGFHALFQQYQKYVYAIVWDKLCEVGSREDAEECVGDIFAEIFVHYDAIHEGAMQGYIGTVAKRRAINRFNQLCRQEPARSLDDDAMQELPAEETPADTHERNDLHRLLLAKIQALGEPDATIVVQRYYYGCRTEEIARHVRLNPVNVRVRLNRALKRLRKMLSDEGISM